METIKHGNLTIEIRQDDFAESPREWSNVGTMVCWHRRYTLGDEQPDCSPDEFLFKLMSDREFDKHRKYVPDEIKTEHVQAYINKHFFVLPLYLYDHGSITMSASAFSCPWDSGQVGFIYVERTCTEYPDLKAGLLAEVKTYDQYLRGEIYCYDVLDEDGNVLDSCGGFFGHDACVEAGKEAASSLAETLSTSFCI
jgi:hypothetical protein